ncbi:hypothetical protein QUA20_15865 [Microcoleus sp. Pol7_A1]
MALETAALAFFFLCRSNTVWLAVSGKNFLNLPYHQSGVIFNAKHGFLYVFTVDC